MALKNLMRRCDLPAIRGVINTLLQSERYGTPLAQSLRVLSAEYRNERLMRAEEKAARLPAIMTVPMVLFVLPPLFIVLLGPGILRFIDSMKGVRMPH
jgi:tight adherence protein C